MKGSPQWGHQGVNNEHLIFFKHIYAWATPSTLPTQVTFVSEKEDAHGVGGTERESAPGFPSPEEQMAREADRLGNLSRVLCLLLDCVGGRGLAAVSF